jgi:tetratricopeptide (TPR) repeat protein
VNIRILVGTFLALMALGTGLVFWRSYLVRRNASDLSERADALAEQKKYAEAAVFYSRYLELCPDDANVRLKNAEIFEKSSRDRGGVRRTIELYQQALAPTNKGLTAEQRVEAQRRVCELMLEANAFVTALVEAKKLRELEDDLDGEKQKRGEPGQVERHAPGLMSVALAGKFRENNAAVPRNDVEKAFADVLDAKSSEHKLYIAPDVYLARYDYRLHKDLSHTQNASISAAYLEAAAKAKDDLDAALKLAPDNLSVLLTAASEAQRQGEAEALAAREGAPADSAAARAKAETYYSQAIDYYERAIKSAPENPRAYEDLGQLFASHGDMDRAMRTWRRGIKEVQNEALRIRLDLSLADALIEQGHLADAENVLKGLGEILGRLDAQSRLALQRLVDLRSGKLAFLRGRYDETISLVTDMASGNMLVQGEANTATPHERYEAWLLLGEAHAALAPEASSPKAAQQHWDQALTAFEQASLNEPREAAPHLCAAEACRAAGRSDAAIRNYQHALEVVGAVKPPPENLQLAIYSALIGLLDEAKRTTESKLYVERREALMSKSPRLILQIVNEAIRAGNTDAAMKVAEIGVKNHPEDPLTQVALGRAKQVAKQSAEATEAYRKAFQMMKDSPALQADLAESLLGTGNPGDAVEGEKALRELASTYPPACMKLVTYFALRDKADDALAVARIGIQSHPTDPIVHAAMGSAWAAKKDIAKAEAEFQEAARLAPDSLGPARALLEFYVDTGRAKLAAETLDKLLLKAKAPETERELFRGDILVRIGNRQDALVAYRKAVELAKEDPAVVMRLAEFLLASGDTADDIEAQKLLRRIKGQYDPARRRLAQVLMLRGGDAEWEEAQRLLEQSAGDPTSLTDRIAEAELLIRRGGGQNLEKAAALCKVLLAEAKQPLPGVNLMLAQVRELQGNLDDARNQYRTLVEQNNPSPAQLANYIGFLLRHGPAAEADERLKQLEKITPYDVTALELRARWLRDQKRIAEIEPLVEGHMQKVLARLNKGDTRQEAIFSRAAGDLFQRLELYSAAERWYRRLQKLGVEIYSPLAMSIARQGRIQEAVAVCKEAEKSDHSPRPALVVAAILMTGRATPKDLEDTKPYLEKATEEHKDQIALLSCLASINALLDRPAQAIDLYRQILKQQPKNVATLSDLATILAEQSSDENRKEALKSVERAIELAGPQPNLLDTKGMALFYDGQPERAEIALKAAAQSPNPDPRYCFHYAVVCAKLGDLDRARKALRQARDGDLEHQLLTKKDRQLLTELDKQLVK